MQRVTITLEDELADAIDRLVHRRGYQSRSEAIRDLTRNGLQQVAEVQHISGDCVAALVYVYEHGTRDLAKRLTRTFHAEHELAVSALHVHLDHDTCLEVSLLRGSARAVRRLADHVIAERGVHYGRLVMIPVNVVMETHGHSGGAPRRHLHTHVRPGGEHAATNAPAFGLRDLHIESSSLRISAARPASTPPARASSVAGTESAR